MAGVPGVRYLPQDRLQILTRYNEIGLEGLTDRSRRRYRHATQLPFQIETQIVRLNQDKPSWGTEDQGAAGPSLSGRSYASTQHGACGPRSPRPGQTQKDAAQQGNRNGTLAARPTQ
jgi:hypothetical protein